jgi:hypothetical protein
MARIQYHREHPPEPAVGQFLEKESFDCALEDDEEVEKQEPEEQKDPERGMVEEIVGLDEEISPIEKWQASGWSQVAEPAGTCDTRHSAATSGQ